MNSEQIEIVQAALSALNEVLAEEVANIWLRQETADREIRIYGDTVGLVHLSRQLLKLALKDAPGSHLHLDEASDFESCDQSLVIGKELAKWEA